MENKIVKFYILLALLACTTSGQEKFMVCKSIENVFTDVGGERPGALTKRIQGPPGKRGVPGSPGPPGIQGLPGTQANVDYDRIAYLIEDKIRRGLEEVNSRVEMMKSNITELTKALPSVHRCEGGNGLFYNGKCYFAPSFSFSSSWNYNDAVLTCNSVYASIAEINSRNHQEALENFFRPKIPSSRSWIRLWTRMLYQSSTGSIRFRSGKEVPINQFKWLPNNPSRSSDNIAIDIRKDTQSSYGGLLTYGARARIMMVLCEI